jgi:hypothetical protein
MKRCEESEAPHAPVSTGKRDQKLQERRGPDHPLGHMVSETSSIVTLCPLCTGALALTCSMRALCAPFERGTATHVTSRADSSSSMHAIKGQAAARSPGLRRGGRARDRPSRKSEIFLCAPYMLWTSAGAILVLACTASATGTMMKGISVAEFGAPDVMKLADIAVPQPRDGEVLVKVYAAGALLPARVRTIRTR